MTRKHFKLIAAQIKRNGAVLGLSQNEVFFWADSFADTLYATNPNFKPEKFIEACFTKEDDK